MGRLLVIGAPVCGRAWILREWFARLRAQAGLDPSETGFVFHVGPSKDATEEIIEEERTSGDWAFVESLHDDSDKHLDSGRRWDMVRFDHMATMRNELLTVARDAGADHYLSCDTDMLLPPVTLPILFRDIAGFKGVAPLTFMTPLGTGEEITNAMGMNTRRFSSRADFPERVYACFGVVLMTPELMSVEYEAHRQGEDLGWAKNAHAAGFKLGITPHVRVKHVMHPDHLELVDARVGF